MTISNLTINSFINEIQQEFPRLKIKNISFSSDKFIKKTNLLAKIKGKEFYISVKADNGHQSLHKAFNSLKRSIRKYGHKRKVKGKILWNEDIHFM